MIRAALYSRVSTGDQTLANQQLALRAHAQARGWQAVEFADVVSGSRDKRPGLDQLVEAARRRTIDVVAVVKLDRLARSVHHLVTLARELEALGVNLVVLDQAIDTTTPSGRFLFNTLAAVAELERDLIRERVVTGLKRVRHQGTKSGKPIGRPRVLVDVKRARHLLASGKAASVRQAARTLGVSASTLTRVLAAPKP